MKTHFSASLLAWLRVFEAVSRNGSFTGAATMLHVSQGAVSQQIKLLERWAQTTLVERHSRGVQLTPRGEQLSKPLRAAFQMLDEALGQLRAEHYANPFELVCSPSFAMHWLMPRTGRFIQRHPDIPLRLQSDILDGAHAAGLPPHVNAAIIFGPASTAHADAFSFLDERVFPVASPAFLREHPSLRSPADLDARHLLHDDCPWPGAGPQAEWRHYFQQLGVTVAKLHLGQHFNLSQLAARAAVSGQGIALGRAAIVIDEIRAGRLVDIFGIHMPSPASYRFLQDSERSEDSALLLMWIIEEAQLFLRDRDEVLCPA